MQGNHNKNCLISVVIPVYNGEFYLAEAIQSVLDQTYRPIEIIVVDDGSTDKTAQIAAGFEGNIRYLYQTNSGPAVARNRGIRMATGNVLGFIDADDLWSENHLEVLSGELAAETTLDIVIGLVQLMISAGLQDGKIAFETFGDPSMTLNLGSALYKKSVFNKVGLFDPALYFSEDADWFMRARECNVTMRILNEVTLFYRRHGNNMTFNMLRNDNNLVKVLKKSLDRRRVGNTGSVRILPGLSDFCVEKKETLNNSYQKNKKETDE